MYYYAVQLLFKNIFTNNPRLIHITIVTRHDQFTYATEKEEKKEREKKRETFRKEK